MIPADFKFLSKQGLAAINGRIIKRDLDEASNIQKNNNINNNIIEPSSIRKIIAERTTKTKNEVPVCLLYTSPSPRDRISSRMPSSA